MSIRYYKLKIVGCSVVFQFDVHRRHIWWIIIQTGERWCSLHYATIGWFVVFRAPAVLKDRSCSNFGMEQFNNKISIKALQTFEIWGNIYPVTLRKTPPDGLNLLQKCSEKLNLAVRSYSGTKKICRPSYNTRFH